MSCGDHRPGRARRTPGPHRVLCLRRRRSLLDLRAWGTDVLLPILAWHDISSPSLLGADDTAQRMTKVSAQTERRGDTPNVTI